MSSICDSVNFVKYTHESLNLSNEMFEYEKLDQNN